PIRRPDPCRSPVDLRICRPITVEVRNAIQDVFHPTRTQETHMLLVREIMYCKPGKVRPVVEKFLAMAKLSAKVGMPKMRVMTDVCSDRYWMLVAEME